VLQNTSSKAKGQIIKTKLKGGRDRISWGFICDAPRNGTGKRRQIVRKGFKREGDAQNALDKAIKAYKDSIDPPAQIQAADVVCETFESYFTNWLQQHGAMNWGKLTLEINQRRAAYAIRKFGDVPLQQLTAERIEEDLAALKARGGRKTKQHPEGMPLSGKTVREIAALVNQCLKKAKRRKHITQNPMDDVDRPNVEKREVQILETDDFEKLLHRVRATRYYAMMAFAGDSGCRRGEILAVKWSDIDMESGVATISKSLSETSSGLEIKSTKSGRTRHVSLSESTIQILLEHRAQIKEDQRLFGSDYIDRDLVFCTPEGDYYVPSQITNRITEFMKEAGIKSSMHKLRQFSISTLLSKGAPLPVVSSRAGHANGDITLKVYGHTMKGDDAAAAKIWDDATAAIIARTRKPAPKPGLARPMLSLVIPKVS
jgi:integrase